MLFPEIIESRPGDNNPFTYLANSKELERYYLVLISLYPIYDPRLLHTTRNLKESIDSLWRNNGAKYTVDYLKEANRLVQFFVAGNPQSSDADLRIGAPGGLPIIIPANHRDLIRNNIDHRDYPNICRIIFALLGCYRLIRYPGKLKLETITDPTDSKGISPWELGYNLSLKFKPLFDQVKPGSYSYNLLSLTTAGPNNSISLLSAPLDAIALKGTDVANGLKVLSSYFKLGTYPLLEKEWEVLSDVACKKGTELLGKLSIKEEPAGKRRVFAIVDIWTQSILKPMHDHVFSILRLIKQDGAFDQLRPVRMLIGLNRKGKTFCYDLSAATDRFPISVQIDVLAFLYNREVAEAWKQVLVGRQYYLRETNTFYTYGAGQPMGALSSWGVFSLCHHLIVQIAATRVGIRTWFTEYALLGDDIAITNPEVAEEYYKIMTEELKVQINKAKSLQSDQGVIEFAKRIIGPRGDFSPVGPKNLSLFLGNKLHISSLLVDLSEKMLGIDYFFVQKFLTTLKSKSVFSFTWTEMHALLWSLSEPFGFLYTYTMTPLKWRQKLSTLGAVGAVRRLLEFCMEEWSLNRDKALASCKDCIDLYDGFTLIHDTFFHSDALPSLREQKLKLIEEYARISNLTYPTIHFQPFLETRNDNPDIKSWVIEPWSPVGIANIPLAQWGFISWTDGKTSVGYQPLTLIRPESVLSEVIKVLEGALPPIVPMTSVFADQKISRRSLRHVSFRFLKKFLNWQPTVTRSSTVPH